MINNNFLSTCALFASLDPGQHARILALGERRQYPAEAFIFHEGQTGDGLFIILSGGVRISKRPISGEEALAILQPGAFFGEMALIDYLPRAADAIAHGMTEVFFIPMAALRGALEVDAQLAARVLSALCKVLTQRLREANDRLMGIFTLAQWSFGQTSNPIPLP